MHPDQGHRPALDRYGDKTCRNLVLSTVPGIFGASEALPNIQSAERRRRLCGSLKQNSMFRSGFPVLGSGHRIASPPLAIAHAKAPLHAAFFCHMGDCIQREPGLS